MLSHVHTVIRPLERLERVLQSRKLWRSRQINKVIGRAGTLWQAESHDRIIQDTEHLWKALQYVGKNPRLAGLDGEESTAWIRPGWEELGWKFEMQ